MISTRVNTDGLMSQLSEEIIESYDTGASGKAVEDIIDDLLAFQRKATQITKGTISVAGTRGLEVTNQTIQTALLQLQESIGGYMSVDNDRKLQWPTTIGEDKGQQIRYRKNLTGITRDIDYGGYCTKLHPSSSEESLSDLTVEREEVDKDSDVSYGYLMIPDSNKYACYNGWTGLGNALPSHVSIYEEDEIVWVSPTWSIDYESAWFDEPKAFDDNLATNAWDYVPAGGWTEELELTNSTDPGVIDAIGLRIMFTDITASGIDVKVWVTGDTAYGEEDWDLVVNVSLVAADNDIWKEYTFSGRKVWKALIKVRNGAASSQYIRLVEFDWKTELEVTSDFHQGADERTLRCAIGDYDPAATYVVYYQRANYLIAWDKVVDADDLVSKAVTNKYEVYAISLLEAARLLLDELKEVPITYTINAVDLSKNKDFRFAFEALQLGSILTVIDEDLGIDVPVRVVSLTHPDLLSPQKITIELSTRVKDISDYLADLHKQFG